jgi:hypothetical protein
LICTEFDADKNQNPTKCVLEGDFHESLGSVPKNVVEYWKVREYFELLSEKGFNAYLDRTGWWRKALIPHDM